MVVAIVSLVLIVLATKPPSLSVLGRGGGGDGREKGRRRKGGKVEIKSLGQRYRRRQVGSSVRRGGPWSCPLDLQDIGGKKGFVDMSESG